MKSIWKRFLKSNELLSYLIRKNLIKNRIVNDKKILSPIKNEKLINICLENKKNDIKISCSSSNSKLSKIRHILFDKHLLLTNIMISVSLSGTGDVLQQFYQAYYKNNASTESINSHSKTIESKTSIDEEEMNNKQLPVINTNKSQVWNSTRTLHMSLSGTTIGVLCHYWYIFLDRNFPGKNIRIIFKKVIIDQIIFSPIAITTFFVTLGILESSTKQEIWNEMVEKGKQLYLAEWVVWPPAQIINFYFLNIKYRILYDNVISLGYDVYTSYVKHDHR